MKTEIEVASNLEYLSQAIDWESWPALRALNNRNGKYYFDPPLQ